MSPGLPDRAAEIETIRLYLGTLEAEALAGRLLAVAERDEGLRLGLLVEARAAAGELDLAELKKQLTAQLRVSSRHLSWHGAREYAREAESALDVLEGLLNGGHPEPVIALAEHAMKRLDTALGRIDDSGGTLAWPVTRVNDLHLRACVAARPESRKLAVRLLEIAFKSDWEWFIDAPERYAEVLGEEGLAAYRERLEREWVKVPARLPDRTRRYASRAGGNWLVAHLKESLARASGSVDELIAVMAHDLGSPYQFERIAVELEKAGRDREALGWLERAVREFGLDADSRVRDHLIDAYLRDGQVEDALALAERAFESTATATTYRLLERVCAAAGIWETARPKSLAVLRERPGGHYPRTRTELVIVLLDDGDIEAAWTEAVAGGCAEHLRARLAEALGATRPDDAASIYRDLVAETLRDTHHYRDAVKLLKTWREMLDRHGRQAEMAFDIRRIRDENRRRPTLIALLDKAGFTAV